MRDYVLVSDSTADMNVEVVKKLDVKIIPFSYSVNDNVYQYYLDERDGDINEFYANMKKGAMPVTSQVNPITYKEYFKLFFVKPVFPVTEFHKIAFVIIHYLHMEWKGVKL